MADSYILLRFSFFVFVLQGLNAPNKVDNMATVVNFHGKNYIEPGSYAATVYNPTSVVNVAEFGNVMIIDTGLSMNGSYEFAGGQEK